MRLSMGMSYAGGFHEAVAGIADYERAGLDAISVSEAYSYDAVSQLGYLAARTQRLELVSNILQIYTRTPALTAMTAASLDFVSGGRFVLGLGASGPQVIEGFHGVPYDAPVGRTREIIEICRKVWRRERLAYDGRYYHLPLPEGQGTGLGKSLRLINQPVRENIPVFIASLGPRNVALTAEVANGWVPLFYRPESAADVWGKALAEGAAKRDPDLGPLQTIAPAGVAIGEDTEAQLDSLRPRVALYVGGMGAKGRNFYNDLVRRYGFEREAELVQDLYLDGKKREAEAALPRDLLASMSLIGPESYVHERIAAFREAGATGLAVSLLHPEHAGRVKLLEKLRDMTG